MSGSSWNLARLFSAPRDRFTAVQAFTAFGCRVLGRLFGPLCSLPLHGWLCGFLEFVASVVVGSVTHFLFSPWLACIIEFNFTLGSAAMPSSQQPLIRKLSGATDMPSASIHRETKQQEVRRFFSCGVGRSGQLGRPENVADARARAGEDVSFGPPMFPTASE